MQYVGSDGETYYPKVDTQTIKKGEWVQLSNTDFRIPEDARNIVLYVETAESKNSFYVDDVVGAVAGTVIPGAGKPVEETTEESTEPEIVYEKGDVNNDGVVDVFDLSLAKQGVLSGFKDQAAEKSADLDGDGTVSLTDLIALTKFLHGKA
jgi:hypothetical protein